MSRLRRTATTACCSLLGLAVGGTTSAATLDPPNVSAIASTPRIGIDPTQDPILVLADNAFAATAFRQWMLSAVRRHPAVAEARAGATEAQAARTEARAQLLPRVDLSFSSYRVASRAFSNDPQNIIERSRADRRTDALASIDQTVFDFGATSGRIRSATSRLNAAAADVDTATSDVALRAIAAWYNVFAYRELVSLAEALTLRQRQVRAAILQRIALGATAPGDVARVDSYIASADTRHAVFQRSLSTAEAQFLELFGHQPPADLLPAPALGVKLASGDAAAASADRAPPVRAALAIARASRLQARAAHADTLPIITAGVDAGRYGVFETARDYDVRGRVTARLRLFGGIGARAAEADARADAADARGARVAEEQRRDAIIAWSDVNALDRQLEALRQSYVASRQSRDVLLQRFVASRGTLFDVLDAEDGFFQTSAAYVQAVAERDAARYVLLAKTGLLLDALEIPPFQQEYR